MTRRSDRLSLSQLSRTHRTEDSSRVAWGRVVHVEESRRDLAQAIAYPEPIV